MLQFISIQVTSILVKLSKIMSQKDWVFCKHVYIVTKIEKCSSQNTNCKIVTSKYSDVWVKLCGFLSLIKVFKTLSGNNL